METALHAWDDLLAAGPECQAGCALAGLLLLLALMFLCRRPAAKTPAGLLRRVDALERLVEDDHKQQLRSQLAQHRQLQRIADLEQEQQEAAAARAAQERLVEDDHQQQLRSQLAQHRQLQRIADLEQEQQEAAAARAAQEQRLAQLAQILHELRGRCAQLRDELLSDERPAEDVFAEESPRQHRWVSPRGKKLHLQPDCPRLSSAGLELQFGPAEADWLSGQGLVCETCRAAGEADDSPA